MDEDAKEALSLMDMPRRKIAFVPVKNGEILKLGHITCRVIEDGSNTDNRISIAEFTLPPHTAGPPAHWHEMHDECFHTTLGTVRYHAPDHTHVDAGVGDFVIVPTRAPHTFSNPFDTEAKFVNTYTPSFYINYFKILAEASKGDTQMSKEKNLEVMSHFATVLAKPLVEEMMGDGSMKAGK